jgi:uncharacterized membrane protein
MWIGMMLFWTLVACAIYALVTAASRRPRRDADDGGKARHILDQRLASGEIDDAEYRRLRGLIESGDKDEPASAGTVR